MRTSKKFDEIAHAISPVVYTAKPVVYGSVLGGTNHNNASFYSKQIHRSLLGLIKCLTLNRASAKGDWGNRFKGSGSPAEKWQRACTRAFRCRCCSLLGEWACWSTTVSLGRDFRSLVLPHAAAEIIGLFRPQVDLDNPSRSWRTDDAAPQWSSTAFPPGIRRYGYLFEDHPH